MSKWNICALTNLKGDLKVAVKVKDTGMLDKLEKPLVDSGASLGFVNREVMLRVKALPTQMDMMDMIIDHLSGKEDKYFNYFCTILKDRGYEDWSKKLREEAEKLKKAVGKFVQFFRMHVKCKHAVVYKLFFPFISTVSDEQQAEQIDGAPDPPGHDPNGENVPHLHSWDCAASTCTCTTRPASTLYCQKFSKLLL